MFPSPHTRTPLRLLDHRERFCTRHVPLPEPTPVWDPYTQQLVIKTFKEDRQRVAEYLVKWRGLAYTDATWETENWVLENASDKVDIFRHENDMPPLGAPMKLPQMNVHQRCGRYGATSAPFLSWGRYLCRNQNDLGGAAESMPLFEYPGGILKWGNYLCKGANVRNAQIYQGPSREHSSCAGGDEHLLAGGSQPANTTASDTLTTCTGTDTKGAASAADLFRPYTADFHPLGSRSTMSRTKAAADGLALRDYQARCGAPRVLSGLVLCFHVYLLCFITFGLHDSGGGCQLDSPEFLPVSLVYSC